VKQVSRRRVERYPIVWVAVKLPGRPGGVAGPETRAEDARWTLVMRELGAYTLKWAKDHLQLGSKLCVNTAVSVAVHPLERRLAVPLLRRAAARDENRRQTRSSLVLKVAHSCSAL